MCLHPQTLFHSKFLEEQSRSNGIGLLQRPKDFEEEGRIRVLSGALKESLIETKLKSKLEELRNITNKVQK